MAGVQKGQNKDGVAESGRGCDALQGWGLGRGGYSRPGGRTKEASQPARRSVTSVGGSGRWDRVSW